MIRVQLLAMPSTGFKDALNPDCVPMIPKSKDSGPVARGGILDWVDQVSDLVSTSCEIAWYPWYDWKVATADLKCH